MNIPLEDLRFLRHAMRVLSIPAIKVKTSSSKAKWPDIWVELGQVPTITVTRAWAKQNSLERRKRLVHELLHVLGHGHGPKGSLVYSTYPDKDTFSLQVYRALNRNWK